MYDRSGKAVRYERIFSRHQHKGRKKQSLNAISALCQMSHIPGILWFRCPSMLFSHALRLISLHGTITTIYVNHTPSNKTSSITQQKRNDTGNLLWLSPSIDRCSAHKHISHSLNRRVLLPQNLCEFGLDAAHRDTVDAYSLFGVVDCVGFGESCYG